MKLKHYLEQNSPFVSKESIDNLMMEMKSRNTCIDDRLRNRLLSLCETDVIPYLEEKMESYISVYKQIPGKPRIKGKCGSRKSASRGISSSDYYQQNYPDSLAAKGYSYGLSDW